jgi:HAD superfamily hydrolase (TIGR01490 family)
MSSGGIMNEQWSVTRLCDSADRRSRVASKHVNGVAIVDLDNTLIRGSYLFHFGVSMVRRRLLSPRPILPFLLDEARYVHRRGERAGMPDRIAECVLSLVEGRDHAEAIASCRQFVSQSLDRVVVPEVLTVIEDLQDLGIPAYIATASPQEIADAVADRLGLAGAIGTISEVQDGRYTGRLATPIAHGAEKLRRVQELLAELDVDPAQSWAFSDSINDAALLEAVGWPVAVNADEPLRRAALANSWLMIDCANSRRSGAWADHLGRRQARGAAAQVPVPRSGRRLLIRERH